jgi:maltooligosyltrehalose trehalohydrolase
LYQGQQYRWHRRRRGTPAFGIPRNRFVSFIENHDQVANSGVGDRLHRRAQAGRWRALTALLLLGPQTPMLFQGQEFGASTPFRYFADHRPELAAAVQKGRAEFLSQFPSLASPEAQRCLPPPHDPQTFESTVLDWSEYDTHVEHRRLYEDLIAMRRFDRAFVEQESGRVDGAVLAAEAFVLHYFAADPQDERLLCVNLGTDLVAGSFAEPLVAPPDGFSWALRWSSEDPDYGGAGTPEVAGANGWRLPGHSALVLAPARWNFSESGPKR